MGFPARSDMVRRGRPVVAALMIATASVPLAILDLYLELMLPRPADGATMTPTPQPREWLALLMRLSSRVPLSTTLSGLALKRPALLPDP
jgi:hypothetical protein